MGGASIDLSTGNVTLANGEPVLASEVTSIRVGRKPKPGMFLVGFCSLFIGIAVHFLTNSASESYSKIGLTPSNLVEIGNMIAICFSLLGTALISGSVIAGKFGVYLTTSVGIKFADFQSRDRAENAMAVMVNAKNQKRTTNSADELAKLFSLKQSGAISEAEFDSLKKKILSKVA
jgi:hypothetical protein